MTRFSRLGRFPVYLPILGLILGGCAIIYGGQSQPWNLPGQEQLSRTNLLEFIDRGGSVKSIKHKADWELRRRAILHSMESIMGEFPGPERRCDLALQVDEEIDCGIYLRRRISFNPEPGERLGAYLLIPKACLTKKQKAPGVLCLHQTHREGSRVVVGLGNSPHDEYGVELAKRGYVCIAPPYPLLADYSPDLSRLGYRSGTMKAIWNNIRCLDLLDSLPFVKRGRYASIGHSLGGHNGLFTAVFDQRVKIVVTSCGFDAFTDYMDGNIKGWTSSRYMPALANFQPNKVPFDFSEVLGAIAPRSIFVSAPVNDSNFKWASVDRVAREAQAVYALYGKPNKLTITHPGCAHLFPPEIRQQSYRAIEGEIGKGVIR